MIANERELQTTMERIAWFQQQLTYLRRTEADPVNYRAAASGFLAEIDRMQLEVREYFSFLPAMARESPNRAPRQTAAAFSASREFTMLSAAAACLDVAPPELRRLQRTLLCRPSAPELTAWQTRARASAPKTLCPLCLCGESS